MKGPFVPSCTPNFITGVKSVGNRLIFAAFVVILMGTLGLVRWDKKEKE
jgi:hypothetical protein